MRVLSLAAVLLLAGCGSKISREEIERELRLKCPCVLFSEEQKEIFKRLLPLDYYVVVPASGLQTIDAIRLEKSTTFGVRISDSCLINKNILGSAESDDIRFKKFYNAMHTDHKVLWALRGGYGSYRLINSLKSYLVRSTKKFL